MLSGWLQAQEPQKATGTNRLIHGRVLLPGGSPAQGVTVYLLQAARPSYLHFVGMYEAKRNPHYQFRADSAGRFEIPMARTSGNEQPDPAKPVLFGHGVYFFLVPPSAQYAGALSPPICNPDIDGEFVKFWKDDWSDAIVLADQPLDLRLRIEKGRTLDGRVETMQGSAVPNATVQIHHDVHFNSHTGRGGEIFETTATTKVDGTFKFEHVFPGACKLSLKSSWIWKQTKIGKQSAWIDNCVDELGDATGWIGIRVVSPAALKVWGQVTDDAGRPIIGAKVSIGRTRYRKPNPWDKRSPLEVVTDTHGVYEILLDSPWIPYFRVEKENYEPLEKEMKDEAFPTGKYDFKLKQKTPGQILK